MIGLSIVLGVALAVTATLSMWEGAWWVLPKNSFVV